MFNTIFSKGSLPVAEQWLYFTRMRHDAIANNIANVDTPHYKAIDAPVEGFRDAMDRAIKERDRLRVPVFHFEGNSSVHPKAGGGLSVEFEEPGDLTMLRHVENNVDMDVEMGKLVKNAMRHNLVSNIMAHQFSIIREAISERVSA